MKNECASLMRPIARLFSSIRLVVGVLALLLVASGNAIARTDEKPVIYFSIAWPRAATGIEWADLRIPFAYNVSNTAWSLSQLADTQLFQKKQGKMTVPAFANFTVSAFWPEMVPVDEMKWLVQPEHDKSLQVYALLESSAIDTFEGVMVNRLQYDLTTFSAHLDRVCYYPRVEKNEKDCLMTPYVMRGRVQM